MRLGEWVSLIASVSSAVLLVHTALVAFRLRSARSAEPHARILFGATLLLLFVSLTLTGAQWYQQRTAPADVLISALVLSCALFLAILMRDQGRLEQLVEQRTSELSTVNVRLQSLLDNLPAGVVFASAPSGETLLVNREAVDMLGMAPDARSLGPGGDGTSLWHSDGSPYGADELPLARTLATGSPHRSEDLVVQHPGRGRMRLLMTAAPVCDARGRMTSAICVFQDITEREKLQALRDSLTHIIVHDLRNPLHAIAGYMELMTESGYIARGDDAQECLRHVRTNCQNLINMTTALLDLSRLEAGEMPIQLKEWRLSEVWSDAYTETAALARLKQLRLAVRVSQRLPPIRADRTLLRRVLVNLLTNAICFAPNGTTITVGAQQEGDFVQVAVTDVGPGIPPEHHEWIFRKSAGLDTGTRGGRLSTGLGLSFCKLAVEMQGGTIGVDSEVGRGSSFWFTVPLIPSEASGLDGVDQV